MRSRVKWSIVGDKWIVEFFKMVRQKNYVIIIIYGPRDIHGRKFPKREDLDRICHDFHQNLYKQKEILEKAFHNPFEAFKLLLPKL